MAVYLLAPYPFSAYQRQGPPLFLCLLVMAPGLVHLDSFHPHLAIFPAHFQIGKVTLMAMILLDFMYYFGLKTKNRVGLQVWAGTLLLPFLMLYFWPLWQTRNGPRLNLPHSGKALVWTDSIWQPEPLLLYGFREPALHPERPQFPRSQFRQARFFTHIPAELPGSPKPVFWNWSRAR